MSDRNDNSNSLATVIRDRLRLILDAEDRPHAVNRFQLAHPMGVIEGIIEAVSILTLPSEEVTEAIANNASAFKATLKAFVCASPSLARETVGIGVVASRVPRAAYSTFCSAIWQLSCEECSSEKLCDEHFHTWAVEVQAADDPDETPETFIERQNIRTLTIDANDVPATLKEKLVNALTTLRDNLPDEPCDCPRCAAERAAGAEDEANTDEATEDREES